MRSIKFFTYVLLLSAPSLGLISCGDDDPSDDGSNGSGTETPGGPETPGGSSTPLTSYEQKQKLEKVAIDFMNMVPSSDFNRMHDLAEYIREEYSDYEFEDDSQFENDIYDELVKYVGEDTETKKDPWGNIIRYEYTDYNLLVVLSNITGHFEADKSSRSWTYTKANDLQFAVKNKAGQKCVAKLTSSGKTKDVYIGKIEEYDDYDYPDGGGSIITEYIDRYNTTVSVPEHICFTFTEGSETIVKVDVNINISNLDGNTFNFAKNSFDLSASIETNIGYQISLKQLAYKGNKSVAMEYNVTKNGVKLVNMNASTDISGIPSFTVKDLVEDNTPDDLKDMEDNGSNANNAYVSVNIMDKVKVMGKVKNVRRYVENLIDADENDENEGKFKSYINQANELADINIYYDNKSTKQAKVELEPFEDSYYYGKYWYADYVLRFNDGSTYSTFDTFFGGNEFKDVVKKFEKLMENYKELLGIEDDEDDEYYPVSPNYPQY